MKWCVCSVPRAEPGEHLVDAHLVLGLSSADEAVASLSWVVAEFVTAIFCEESSTSVRPRRHPSLLVGP